MKDILLICKNPKCICEDVCCQLCQKLSSCNKKCGNVKYKEQVYSSNHFLVSQLEFEGDEQENWLMYVAAERIRELSQAKGA